LKSAGSDGTTGRPGLGQLTLDILARGAALPYRLHPMQPVNGDAPFDDPDWFFEPWWPGAPTLAYIQGAHVRLQSTHMTDPLIAFPELAVMGGQFNDDNLIVEGTLLVLDDEGRPDQELLRGRLAGPSARHGSPAFVVSDLLYEAGRPLLGRPFEERRGRLGQTLTDGDMCVISRGLRGEGSTLAEAAASMGIAEISARLLAAAYHPGAQDPGWLRLPVVATPVTPTRPLLALLQRLPL
jgi:bifunctional non-homologous end joining protein LigD